MTPINDASDRRRRAGNTVFVYNGFGKLVEEYSVEIETESPQVSYLTTDRLGSPRVTTDKNGLVTSRKDFTAFGEETITNERSTELGYEAPQVRQNYTGYQKDMESGLEFAQARYYNPTHGRFTSVDPLTASASVRNPQTLNRFSYVLNSPYKYTDPLGLIAWGSGFGGGGGFCSASAASCENGEDMSTASIDAYHKEQEERERRRQKEAAKEREQKRQRAKKPDPPLPKVYDVRKDEAILAAVAAIKAKATPLPEGTAPVLTDVKVVIGATVTIEDGTVIDGYGNSGSDFTGTLQPAAYIPLDQGGNIIQGNGVAVTERVKVVSGNKPQTTDEPAPTPPGGVFIDIQSIAAGEPTSTIEQAVFVGQFSRPGAPAKPVFRIGVNEITKDAGKKTISIKIGNTAKVVQ